MKTQAEFKKTALRLPPDLHKQIHQAANAQGRSFNSEILQRLSASFAPAKPGKAAS